MAELLNMNPEVVDINDFKVHGLPDSEEPWAETSEGTIKVHPDNPRDGDIPTLRGSISENGFFTVIGVHKSTGLILDGNHRFIAALLEGAERLPIGWIEATEAEANKILAAANRTSDLAGYDTEELSELLKKVNEQSETGLQGTGFDESDYDELLEELNLGDEDGNLNADKYVQKIDSPVYERGGKKPNISDLYNESKTEKLLQEIDEHDLPPEVERFLRFAAYRHTEFTFSKIAEYYAHASEEVQNLMERSAFVILDFEDAIDQGFVNLTEDLAQLVGEQT